MLLIHGRCACGRTTGQLCALCHRLVCWMAGEGCAMKTWLAEREVRVHVRCARAAGLWQPDPPPPPGPPPSVHALRMRAYYRENIVRIRAEKLARYHAGKGATA